MAVSPTVPSSFPCFPSHPFPSLSRRRPPPNAFDPFINPSVFQPSSQLQQHHDQPTYDDDNDDVDMELPTPPAQFYRQQQEDDGGLPPPPDGFMAAMGGASTS